MLENKKHSSCQYHKKEQHYDLELLLVYRETN